MVELKFTAQKSNGQPITGTVTAATALEGKRKFKNLLKKTGLNLQMFRKNLLICTGYEKEKKNQ
ncbi:MAG: hypothetical protein M5T52_18080 [Ignavibacteriaceae bacterium]|nr:hypothetical protein [Ignavibacteriaceae bacterium]